MTVDVAIIGAGIAGASLAAAIGGDARVVLIEGEEQPGYHATGRSAAFWSETYGGPAIQPLTTASAGGLADHLQPLGSLHIGRAGDAPKIAAFLAEFDGTPIRLDRVEPAALVPGLKPDWCLGVAEPSCAFIDVAGYHAECLGVARRAGTTIMCNAELAHGERENGRWRLVTGDGRTVSADVVVDAAGAWADVVAQRCGVAPLGIRPYRRTMVQLATQPAPPADLPHVADIGGGFYFKPETGGRLWLSPHDETPVDAHDVVPEELDVATAVARFEAVVDWRVKRVERRWAGLRSFAPDRLPVYGYAPAAPGFFWCAGQGGFGIQTAPAAAAMAASLLLRRSPPDWLGGINPLVYAPDRAALR